MYMDIPILVMSSQPREKATKELKRFKTEGYIQKDSFDQTEFVELVKNILGKYHE